MLLNTSFGRDSVFTLSKDINLGLNINGYIGNLYTLTDRYKHMKQRHSSHFSVTYSTIDLTLFPQQKKLI